MDDLVTPHDPVSDCDCLNCAIVERNRLMADRGKLERALISHSDIIENHCIAMQSAIIDSQIRSHADGLRWIYNTLYGPGLIPDIEEARAMGGAQAWFDAKSAEHALFRKEHPAPERLAVAAC